MAQRPLTLSLRAEGDVAFQSKIRQAVILKGALRAGYTTGLLRAANNDDVSETLAARFRARRRQLRLRTVLILNTAVQATKNTEIARVRYTFSTHPMGESGIRGLRVFLSMFSGDVPHTTTVTLRS